MHCNCYIVSQNRQKILVWNFWDKQLYLCRHICMVVINGLLLQRGKLNDRLFRTKFWKWTVIKHVMSEREKSLAATKSGTSFPSEEIFFSELKGFSDLCRTARFISMFRETHHWTLFSVEESTLQRFNTYGTWSYATGCVVAAKLKNCSALQTALTAHPSTHHHIPEDWIPSSITVITSNLPLRTHSFTMQHSV